MPTATPAVMPSQEAVKAMLLREAQREEQCPLRHRCECSDINMRLGWEAKLKLEECDVCWQMGGPSSGAAGEWRREQAEKQIAHWKADIRRAPHQTVVALTVNHMTPEEAAAVRADPVVQRNSTKKERWGKVEGSFRMAESFVRSMLSKGFTGNRAEPAVVALRQESCKGCDARTPSVLNPGKHYCNECGCGDREMALLDGEPYSKLEYPFLECPREMPGFSNATSLEGDMRGVVAVPAAVVEVPPEYRMVMPKLLHWVWVGGSRIPDAAIHCIESWTSRHPGWDFVVWMEKLHGQLPFERPLFPIVNWRWYDDIARAVGDRAVQTARSDILRAQAVAQYGGIYLDTDVECFRNIEPLMAGVRLFIADEFGDNTVDGNYGSYMMGGVPNHPAMWTVVRGLKGHLHGFKKPGNAVQATGPTYINSRLRGHPDLVVFPHMLFNPLSAFEDPKQVTHIPRCSYANHEYHGYWYDRVKSPPVPEFRGAVENKNFRRIKA